MRARSDRTSSIVAATAEAVDDFLLRVYSQSSRTVPMAGLPVEIPISLFRQHEEILKWNRFGQRI
jgi:hypothetical protein